MNEISGSADARRYPRLRRLPCRRPSRRMRRPVPSTPVPKHSDVVVKSQAVARPTPPAWLHEIPVSHGKPESQTTVAVEPIAAPTVTIAAKKGVARRRYAGASASATPKPTTIASARSGSDDMTATSASVALTHAAYQTTRASMDALVGRGSSRGPTGSLRPLGNAGLSCCRHTSIPGVRCCGRASTLRVLRLDTCAARVTTTLGV